MNILSKDKEQAIIDIYNTSVSSSINAMSRTIGVSAQTFKQVLIRNQIEYSSSRRSQYKHELKRKTIINMYVNNDRIADIVKSAKCTILDVFDALSGIVNVVDDNFIKWLFYNPSTRELYPGRASMFENFSLDSKPELAILTYKYLNNRYLDSESIKETVHRILHNIETRPVCALCGKPVKFMASSGILFQKFCSSRCSSMSEDTINARRRTCMQLYGDCDYNNVEQNKLTCKNRYGVENVFQADWCKEKIANTNIDRFGVVNPAFSSEIWERRRRTTLPGAAIKAFQTKKRNHTLNSSYAEDRVYDKLCHIFKSQNVFRNWKDPIRYNHACDFYIKPLDLFIECNFFWMHGGKFFDENSASDMIKLNKWKEKAKTSKSYRIAIKTWTHYDVRKSMDAIANNLRYIVFWTEKDAIQWLDAASSVLYTSYKQL